MDSITIPNVGVYAIARPVFYPEKHANLTVTAAKSLIPQLKAAGHIEQALLKMLDGEVNARRYNLLKRIAPRGNQGIKDYAILYEYFGTPWLAKGGFSLIPYNGLEEELKELRLHNLPKTRPCFLNLVTYDGKKIRTQKDEAIVREILNEKSKELNELSKAVKDAKHHPLIRWDTCLNITKTGEIEEIKYFDKWRSDLEPAANLYKKAAGIADPEYPIYGFILHKTAQALINGNNFDGLDLMLANNDSPLVTITGPIEQYIITQQDRTIPLEKSGLQVTHGIKNEPETKRLKSGISPLQKSACRLLT